MGTEIYLARVELVKPKQWAAVTVGCRAVRGGANNGCWTQRTASRLHEQGKHKFFSNICSISLLIQTAPHALQVDTPVQQHLLDNGLVEVTQLKQRKRQNCLPRT
jgi:hypothetical protein